MTSEGWIKIHRKLAQWEWADDPNMVALWIHLLLAANYEQTEWHGVTLERGQLATTRKKLSETTGISDQSLRTLIKRLVECNQINVKSTNKFTIITICKYDDYQLLEEVIQPTINQQSTNNQPTINQQSKEIPPVPPKESIEERKKERINIASTDVDALSGCSAPPTLQQPESINYDALVAYFNKITKGVFGTVQTPLSENRKNSVRARIREHGKEAFAKVIAKAMASDFLKGQNPRGFRATFDWLIKPTNFEKVLSGNYDKHDPSTGGGYKGDATIGTDFTRKS